jgi:hypothetical protein
MQLLRPLRWRLRRRRRGLALALTGWLSLSLILTGWPCCELFADTPAPAPSGAADDPRTDSHRHGDHDHDHPPPGYVPGTSTDPCLAWLSGSDLAPGALPDVLPSTPTGDFVWALAMDVPVVSVAWSRSPVPHASGPPGARHVPLYLSTARLRI